jgi:hypothetical protein
MKIEYINLNQDPKLNPEVKLIPLSSDSKNMPPSYCLPWVEAARYSIQLKANEHYVIRKGKGTLDAWAERDGKKLPLSDIWVDLPKGLSVIPKEAKEALEKKVHLSQSPSFSSPWQRKHLHSVTLKLGVYWWTPPGWGLFFTSAIHRNEEFRVVEGMVRTDLWHRDIPVVIQPLVKEVRIPKYSPIASLLMVPAEDIELVSLSTDSERMKEVLHQVTKKRLNRSIYKKLVLNERRK